MSDYEEIGYLEEENRELRKMIVRASKDVLFYLNNYSIEGMNRAKQKRLMLESLLESNMRRIRMLQK